MFRGPARHLANEVMRDLTVSILVGFAAVIACGLLTENVGSALRLITLVAYVIRPLAVNLGRAETASRGASKVHKRCETKTWESCREAGRPL